MRASANAMRVVQVGFDVDPERRPPEQLLRAWPTLPAVASAVARAGVDVHVVQLTHADDAVLRSDGVTYRFVSPDAFAWTPAKRLVDIIRALAPDVVHVHGLQRPAAAGMLAASAGAPVLVQDHGSRAPSGWRRHVWRWAYARTSGVAFTARDQLTAFVEARALSPRTSVYEVLESSTSFSCGDQERAQQATNMYGNPCFLWTGHLDENKDPLTALAAFEIAAARLRDARLWCCFGSAPLLHAVRERIAASSVLRDRVMLVGHRPHAEMELRFRAADFFVQTSHREGSGYSVLEALACGATPLVTDIPSFRRIIADAGSLTPVGDVHALASAMLRWTEHDRSELRRRAKARFDEALTFDHVGRELAQAYAGVLAGTGSYRRSQHKNLCEVAG